MSKTNQNPEVVEIASAVFAEVTIEAPNLFLRFKATPERISRVLEIVLKEARESEAEYEQSLKSLE